MSTTTNPNRRPSHRNTEAEVRAIESGRNAVLDHDGRGPFIKVNSESTKGKWFRVTAQVTGADQPVVFGCEPNGVGACRGDHGVLVGEPGIVPCKHAAKAARRLARHAIVRMDDTTGQWVSLVGTPEPEPTAADPFAGLPQG